MIERDGHLGYGLKSCKLFPTTSVYHITMRATKLSLFRLAFRAAFRAVRYGGDVPLSGHRLSCFSSNMRVDEYGFKVFALVEMQINVCKAHIVKLCKLSYRSLYTKCFVRFANRRIAYLKFLRRPSTVSWLVVPIVVYAIKSKFTIRLFAHIFKKVDKAFRLLAPTITNRYAPTTIPIISSIFRIIAPCNHSSPAIVLRSIYGIPTMSVILISFTKSTFHTNHYNTKCNNLTGVIYG